FEIGGCYGLVEEIEYGIDKPFLYIYELNIILEHYKYETFSRGHHMGTVTTYIVMGQIGLMITFKNYKFGVSVSATDRVAILGYNIELRNANSFIAPINKVEYSLDRKINSNFVSGLHKQHFKKAYIISTVSLEA
ncbi:hypothetical protein ACJX0J_037414, partial [Zea mays]